MPDGATGWPGKKLKLKLTHYREYKNHAKFRRFVKLGTGYQLVGNINQCLTLFRNVVSNYPQCVKFTPYAIQGKEVREVPRFKPKSSFGNP